MSMLSKSSGAPTRSRSLLTKQLLYSSRLLINNRFLTCSKCRNEDTTELMTPEEEAVLDELLQAKRERRKADISEHKRRSKFDPIASRNRTEKVTAASGTITQPPTVAMQQTPLISGDFEAEEIPALKRKPLIQSKLPATVTSAPPSRFSSTSRKVLTSKSPAPEPVVEVFDDDDDDNDSIGEAEFEAAALAFLQEEQQRGRAVALTSAGALLKDDLPQSSVPQSRKQQRPPLRRRTVLAPGSFKPGSSTRLSSSSVPSNLRLGVTSASTTKDKNTYSISMAASPSPPTDLEVVTKDDLVGLEGLGLQGLEGMTRAQLEALLADDEGEVDGAEGGGEAEELDWDTLAAGESFERYLSEIKAEAEQAKMIRGREEAKRQREQIIKAKFQKEEKQKRSSTNASSTLDVELADGNEEDQDTEFDQLLRLLEMVDDEEGLLPSEDGKPSASGISTTVQGRGKTAMSQKVEKEIDWGVLEKMFLGDGWDKEIQDLADQVTGSTPEPLASSGISIEAGRQGAEGDVPAWRDEVTTLLLGLVEISHQCYMNKPILDNEVAEEERADVFWQAPFALLVQDDSKEAMLEYANKKALEAIGCEFDDIYEMSTFDIVASDDAQQQDWIWSISEAQEKQCKYTIVPELRLRGAGGKNFCARNVLIFRVDNLEGEPMGQAILIPDIVP